MKKIKTLLIANRGEIALRIIRSARELGIKTIAVYSEADAFSLHRRFADADLCIGPGHSTESYLNIENIISAAKISNADAIHPGYGFLSENALFREACLENNIDFLGPSSQVIADMGNKSQAREIVKKLQIPLIEGSPAVKKKEDALFYAKKIGYPLLLKAKAGGGGRGMRVVYKEEDLFKEFTIASNEAEKAFRDPDIYIEKYMKSARHIEIQILADKYGNVIHIGDRNCSIQRRKQKVIEEAPSAFLKETVKKAMIKDCIKAAKAIGYEGAGTFEFLVDDSDNYYFIEMNTRIQVEHPISEMISQLDIVKLQIQIAQEEKLLNQEDIQFKGHAIECRINAENPNLNFQPSSGIIKAYQSPGGLGVRIDSHIYQEYFVPPYYDSMIGKLIVWDTNRESCIAKTKRALLEYVIEGIETNISLHLQILDHPKFKKGDYDIHFLEKFLSFKPE